VPFVRPHLDLLAPRAAERLTFGLVGHDPDRAARMAALGPAFTLLAVTGEPGKETATAVASGGVMLSPPAPDGSRVGDAWALTGEEVDCLPLAFHRAVRRGLAAIVAAHRLRRVQALCLAEYEQSRRWLGRLGFTRETLAPGMEGVIPGEFVHLYSLIPQPTQEVLA